MTDNPARLVVEGVEKSLAIAMSWHAWDGRPIAGTVDDTGGGRPNVWTPAKALRRITDHLIELDFDEASSRLRRLGRTYLLTYEMAGPAAWDAPRDPAWTLREIAEHVSGVYGYAEYVGNLR
jgi:hypothetical protein